MRLPSCRALFPPPPPREQSDYFHSEPKMCSAAELPQFEDSHEWEMKQRSRQRRDAVNVGQPLPTSPQPLHASGRDGSARDGGGSHHRGNKETSGPSGKRPRMDSGRESTA